LLKYPPIFCTLATIRKRGKDIGDRESGKGNWSWRKWENF